MDIRLVSKGPTLDAVMRSTVRDFQAATRKVAAPVATAGVKAIKGTGRTFAGKPLTARTTKRVTGSSATVLFLPKPAGPWAIMESGTKAHEIRPKRRQALHFGGRFASHAGHKGAKGKRLWSKTQAPLEAAVGPVIQRVFDTALF